VFELVDLVPAPIYVCEAPTGLITRFNALAVELWGRTPTPGTVDWIAADALRHGRPVRDCRAIVERPDGSQREIAIDLNPVRDGGGAVVAAVAVIRDVSEHRRLEAALGETTAVLRSVIGRLFPEAGPGGGSP
jgi:PAS domain-containing protein